MYTLILISTLTYMADSGVGLSVEKIDYSNSEQCEAARIKLAKKPQEIYHSPNKMFRGPILSVDAVCTKKD